MTLILCLILVPLPSLIWLAFYLRKDKHPEPNSLVIKIFLLGVLAVPLAGVLEFLVSLASGEISFLNKLFFIMVSFALIEEVLKYLVVRFGVLKNPEFDEPVDAMIYLIISALGFAAAENIYLLSVIRPSTINTLLEFITTRFLGATFLHALASGIVGYFLAASLLITSKIRKILILGGILGATILHSVFNYIILLSSREILDTMTRNLSLLILLSAMALIISFMFKKINKYRSICKI